MEIRAYTAEDLPAMRAIWNEVVEDGVAFPQLDALDEAGAAAFFAEQRYAAVVVLDGQVVGLYILHPNNVGRCGHIGNCSYAVASGARGQGVGRLLVSDSLRAARACGFRLIQFNAVVNTNASALHLYAEMGFHRLGTIPGGFLMKDSHYEDIVLFYREV